MAFKARTWVDRQSEIPGRRRLTETGEVGVYDVSREEGLILQEGDLLGAANLNDLEGRIKTEIADKLLRLVITFHPSLAGEFFSVTGPDFSYNGVVPSSLIDIISAPELNTEYMITSGELSSLVTVGNYWGIHEFSFGTPILTYTGTYDLVESVHPTSGRERFYAWLKTSGNLSFDLNTKIDIFMVGGGRSGTRVGTGTTSLTGGGGGGGSGYTINKYGHIVNTSDMTEIIIGSGGAAATVIGGSNSGGSTTWLVNESVLYQSDGAAVAAASSYIGSPGGSGGGGAGSVSSSSNYAAGGAGGYNGANGISGGYAGGAGQGTTTQPFEGDVSPFIGWYFAGGGGGGGGALGGVTSSIGGAGGLGGGGAGGRGNLGAAGATGGNGSEYLGGGGGGGGASNSTYGGNGGAGGSGSIIIRWGDWSE